MSEPIRTLIADDEPLARRQLRSLLERDPQISLVGETASGADTRRAIRELRPELLLLDVRMPQGDGFSVLEEFDKPPYVIFATAHAEHAVHAFDVAAVDYLLKPFDDERFERSIRRAKDAIRAKRLIQLAQEYVAREVAAPAPPVDDSQRITVHDGKRTSWVTTSEIDWIEAADYYAQVHAHGHKHLVRESLQKLEERLGKKFIRAHRSALVNLSRIQRLDKLEGGELVIILQSGTRVPVSRARRGSVMRALGVG
ncbi:MAG TPA: LytTR family DNA-binding domain-containing protein [Steroidobacteraceae bacterium]|jgi:two-component system LytT family response regulator|nr:LytTR family DNA-binding domain-containing protein [Steroidobacteraceae bacterium]